MHSSARSARSAVQPPSSLMTSQVHMSKSFLSRFALLFSILNPTIDLYVRFCEVLCAISPDISIKKADLVAICWSITIASDFRCKEAYPKYPRMLGGQGPARAEWGLAGAVVHRIRTSIRTAPASAPEGPEVGTVSSFQ